MLGHKVWDRLRGTDCWIRGVVVEYATARAFVQNHDYQAFLVETLPCSSSSNWSNNVTETGPSRLVVLVGSVQNLLSLDGHTMI